MAKKRNTQPIPKLSQFVADGKPTEFCWEYITTLAKVVASKYFAKYFEYFDNDDLVSLAITDAVAFVIKVASQNTDDDIHNIRNVLFTRIRNTLSNFIFRSNKLISTDDEILDNTVVYPKSSRIKSDLYDLYDLYIDSMDSFRSVCLRTWLLFKTNGTNKKYFINDDNNDINDWKIYSEIKNMKSPCDLLLAYDKYTDDQIEDLANRLDNITGQNYFSTLYQLLGDKFLAFLDVFQEDKFTIPSTSLVKNILTDVSIIDDHTNGLSDDDISLKYNKSLSSVKRIIQSKCIV